MAVFDVQIFFWILMYQHRYKNMQVRAGKEE